MRKWRIWWMGYFNKWYVRTPQGLNFPFDTWKEAATFVWVGLPR